MNSLAALAVGLPILGGLWGLRQVNASPLRDRHDRRSAFRLAGGVALVVAAVVGFVEAQFAGIRACGFLCFSNTGPDYGVGVVSGAAVGAVIFLGAMAGYAALAKVRVGSSSFAGVLLGLLVLIGGPLLLAIGCSGFAGRP